MGKFSRFGSALYSGRRSINFVGRRWLWYALSGIIVIAAVLGLSVKGLDLGIDFTGGTSYTVTVPGQATQTMADQLRTTVAGTGIKAAEDPQVTTSGQHDLIVQIKSVDQSENAAIIGDIAKTAGVQPKNVSQDQVGASWGSEVARKAITALIIFLVLVVLFIWFYFREWKMSVAALVALAHDVVIAVGVYALSGFQVTPATVTGFLTILGFSLYDTVVVFDKVRENTVPAKMRAAKQGYAEAANLALNQTLVRSINTSLVSLLPVAAILYVSAVQLGASTLKDLALALFVGMAAGTYSSIFIATPLLVHLKQGEKGVVDSERRARRAQADRYADVPVFTEDMPVAQSGTRFTELDDQDDDEDESDADEAPRRPSTRRNDAATGAGRVAPPSRGPVQDSASAGRPQPSRKPRSKRSK